MNNKWHDTDKLMPKKDTVVVGFWEYVAETMVEQCYYDPETKEWFSAELDGSQTSLKPPSYWIEIPY